MPFSQRNIFYLRTSAHVVLQTILYLDPRDLKWMNSHAHIDDQRDDVDEDEDEDRGTSTGDLIWARALTRLRYKIMPKLVAESIEGDLLSSTNKKEKVDTHIEPDFQMAYFFRKVSGRHAVLLKQKDLRFPQAGQASKGATTVMPPPAVPASALIRSNDRDAMPESRLAARQMHQADDVVSQGFQIENEADIEGEGDRKPVGRKRRRAGADANEDLDGFSMGSFTQPIRIKQEDEEIPLLVDDSMEAADEGRLNAPESIDVDELVDDKKPRLHVDYSGFKIFGKCFIVVIEPTKRTKRLRPLLFQTAAPKEHHQLSATPIPRQARETPVPTGLGRNSSSRRSLSFSREAEAEDDDMELELRDSRNSRPNPALFRGTSSEWTPTPTPEPEGRSKNRQEAAVHASSDTQDEEADPDEFGSVMLATQMLEGGIAGEGNDIDDE